MGLLHRVHWLSLGMVQVCDVACLSAADHSRTIRVILKHGPRGQAVGRSRYFGAFHPLLLTKQGQPGQSSVGGWALVALPWPQVLRQKLCAPGPWSLPELCDSDWLTLLRTVVSPRLPRAYHFLLIHVMVVGSGLLDAKANQSQEPCLTALPVVLGGWGWTSEEWFTVPSCQAFTLNTHIHVNTVMCGKHTGTRGLSDQLLTCN